MVVHSSTHKEICHESAPHDFTASLLWRMPGARLRWSISSMVHSKCDQVPPIPWTGGCHSVDIGKLSWYIWTTVAPFLSSTRFRHAMCEMFSQQKRQSHHEELGVATSNVVSTTSQRRKVGGRGGGGRWGTWGVENRPWFKLLLAHYRCKQLVI